MKKGKDQYFFDRKEEYQIGKNKNFQESFNHAMDGILYTAFFEKNMRIDLLIALLAIILSLFYDFSRLEIILLSITITFVLVAESLNTAIENICNRITTEYDPIIKIVKDIAAGASLLAALNAVLVGYLLFINPVKLFSERVIDDIRKEVHHAAFLTIAIILILVVLGKVLFFRGKGSHLRGGFISGHSALAFSLATMAIFTQGFHISSLFSFLIALLVVESRLEANIHTPLEAFLGAILGSSVTALIFWIFT